MRLGIKKSLNLAIILHSRQYYGSNPHFRLLFMITGSIVYGVPYFVNVRKLPDMDAYVGIMLWLELYNKLKRLSFDPKLIARFDIQSAKRIGYLPICSKHLKLENKKLYELLNGKELQE